ncbi:hypothetical protein GALMADRAFT_234328 [Galerina marginata CBS 339.88]|uniref:Homeobox domain-containing protein n=1 Tax=Galerina marginata (strain CBS 339.88) TaxID=685588 RepID=A0A067TQJ7_GALM3|nr:hypothetical protein GALMADRAFT_234328 [Galerina marginata CBS 339.88]
MGSSLDVVINETMQKSLDTFFSSVQNGGESLAAFLQNWSAFNNTIRTHRDTLQQETLFAVHNLASLVNAVTSNVLELEISSHKISNEIVTDVSRILEKKLAISDIPNRETLKPTDVSSYPAYIKPSYDWLLSNLHNPYPPKETKKNISRQTNCPVKDIDAWFIDARKRMGWNNLRRTVFGNKQERIIAGATDHFKPESMAFKDDLAGFMSSEMPSDEYSAGFVAMKDAAESLYSGRFAESPSLTELLDSVQEAPAAVSGTSTKRNGRHKRSRSSQSGNIEPAFSYPTPQPSPSDSQETSAPSTPIAAPVSLPSHSRKRRQSSSDTSEEDAEERQARPQKRLRLDTPEPTEIVTVASLPSPATTIDLTEDSTEVCPSLTEAPAVQEPTAVDEAPRTKRKRRLSDGDDRRPTKRPHNALVVPRLQTVSDPFPIAESFETDSFNEWFQGIFAAERQLSNAIPSPANIEVAESLDSVPLFLHFHQYDFSPYNPEIPLLEDPLTGFESAAPGASLTPSELSQPAETSEKTTHESFSFPDFQGFDLGSFSLNSDYDSLPVPFVGNDFQTPFGPADLLNLDADAFNQSMQSNFWPSDLVIPLNDVCSVEPFSSYVKTPVFGNFNATVRQEFPHTEDQDAKRARAELLREELRLIEAEIAA